MKRAEEMTYNMIREEQMKEIQKQFNEVVEYSQGLDEVNSDSLFKNWKKNKSKFIEAWGGLSVELPQEITLDRPEEDKKILYLDYIADACVFADKGREIKRFLQEQTADGFYQNKVVSRFEDEDCNIKIPAGMKLSKSLKFFFEDAVLLDRFQTRMSRLIQDCKITGKMVMSVHPLDFLSSSETVHNWHSCHALDGEYRAGNLSHMVDAHTFMIYLKSDKDYKLPNFPFEWNSKKWRMLVYAREDLKLFVRGRQYPFSNQTALDIATEELMRNHFDLTNFTNWKSVNYCINQIMKDEIGSLQFNDCLNSPSYTPFGMYDKSIENSLSDSDNPLKMKIGDGVECLECGEHMVSFASSMSCDECAGYSYCDCCGEASYEDDMYYLDGELLCESCWDEMGVYCESCDETFNAFNTDMIWDEDTDMYYCPECYELLMESRQDEEYTGGEL